MRLINRVPPVLLVVYSVLLAVALFSPTSTDQNSMVMWLMHRLHDVGVPWRFIRFDRLEVITNVLIIAPVTFFGSLCTRRLSWRDWTAYAFLTASTVEIVQGLVLPNRQAAFSDVVANTAGALLGALMVACFRFAFRRRS